MALDLYLQTDASLPTTSQNSFLSFEDDGYFGFLYPFFQNISKQTNKEIELYEDSFFHGQELDLFSQMIDQVREEISSKPIIWEEFTGTIVYKGERKVEKIYSTVEKCELEMILLKLEKALTEAKSRNIGIFFFGD